MTLPAATARAPAAIDRCLLPAPRLRQAADVDRRDRQKDGRTPDRYINPDRHHIDENVSIIVASLSVQFMVTSVQKIFGVPGRVIFTAAQ